MKLSIRSKILLGFAVLLLLSYVTQIIGFNVANKFIRLQLSTTLIQQAENAADQIQNFTARIELDQVGIAREFLKVTNNDYTPVIGIIRYTFKQNTFIKKVSILSPTGREILKVDPLKVYSQEELYFEIPTDPFKIALTGQNAISKVYFADTPNAPLIDVYTPIITPDGSISGVIKGQIQLDRLWDVVSQVKLGETGFAYVVDDEGRLIAHHNLDFVKTAPNFRSRSVVGQLLDKAQNAGSTESTSYINEDDLAVVANGIKIPRLNWIVVVEQSEQEALNQINVLRNLFYATLLGSLILLITVSFFLSENLTRPIRKLHEGTNLLTAGNLETRVQITSGDEIEKLAHSFNIMADKLKNSIRELEQKIALLEVQKTKLNEDATLLQRQDLDLKKTNRDLEIEKEAAEAERNKLAVLLAGITDGVIAVDLNRKVVLFNIAAERITGYRANEAIGRTLDQLITLSDKSSLLGPDTYCPIRRDTYEGIVFKKDQLKLIGNNMSSFVNLISGKIKEGAAINLGCILTIHDVTSEQEFERMKLDFVSMAAHELRTPLTTIRGYLSFLQESDFFKNLDEEEKKFLTRAVLSSERLNELIENLLAVSKIEQGKMIIKPTSTDLSGVVGKVVLELTNFAHSKSLELTFNPDPNLPAVMIDPVRIEEVLTNLIGNAINYTQKGSILVTLKQQDGVLVTAVKDTGQGIPKNALPHLFTKFFRIQGELESGSKGTGLGLYISKNIIEAHKGKIWVESEVGVGSTFYFSLPINVATQ